MDLVGHDGASRKTARRRSRAPWIVLGLVAVLLTVMSTHGRRALPILPQPERLLAIAHRGAPLKAPENTIPALEAAVELGANAVEVDLCITQDGHVVLWHDVDPTSPRAMARQLGVGPVPYDPDAPPLWSPYRRIVADLTLEQLQTHYGYDDTQVRIPTMQQFADWLEHAEEITAVFLDIKDGNRAADILRAAMDELGRRGLEGLNIFALNDDLEAIEAMQDVAEGHPGPPVRIVLDGKGGMLETAKALGIEHVSLGKRYWEPMGVYLANLHELLEARRRGELNTVVVWTFDERPIQRTLYHLGVDGIMSNQVDRLVQVRREVLEEIRDVEQDADQPSRDRVSEGPGAPRPPR